MKYLLSLLFIMFFAALIYVQKQNLASDKPVFFFCPEGSVAEECSMA